MSVKLELLKDGLTIAAENYKDNGRMLALFDDKAQKLGTIAGLFLSVPFALIKPDTISTLRNSIGLSGMFVLAGVIVLFVSCVVLCLVSMRVGRIPAPLSLTDAMSFTRELVQLPENSLTDEIQQRYCHEKLRIWADCIHGQDTVASRKWNVLFAAQLVLGIAIGTIGLLLLQFVFAALMAVAPLRGVG
jgi:hypothetical protein